MNLITNNISTLKIHKMTQAQYERELAAGNIDENALYLTPDEARDLSLYLMKDEAELEYESKEAALEKLQEAKEYVETVIIAVSKEIADAMATKDHEHGDLYYTETEINDMLANLPIGKEIIDITEDVENLWFDFSSVDSGLYWSDAGINLPNSTATGLFVSIKVADNMASVVAINSSTLFIVENGSITSNKSFLTENDRYGALNTEDKTIFGAINEINEKLGDGTPAEGVLLYTEQELTPEQRTQARANISGYKWYTVNSGSNKYIVADYAPAIGASSILNCDLANSTVSSISSTASVLYGISHLANFVIQKAVSNKVDAANITKLISEYELIKEIGALSEDYLYLCYKDKYEDFGVGFAFVIAPSRLGGYTHSIQILNDTTYNSTGVLYWNNDTQAYDNSIGRKYIDSTLNLGVYGYAADAKAVGDALATKITGPATATVGQTIAVKAVDENGRPTEWEAVDFTGGRANGGEAQDKEWTLIANFSLEEAVEEVAITVDENGEAFTTDGILLLVQFYGCSENTSGGKATIGTYQENYPYGGQSRIHIMGGPANHMDTKDENLYVNGFAMLELDGTLLKITSMATNPSHGLTYKGTREFDAPKFGWFDTMSNGSEDITQTVNPGKLTGIRLQNSWNQLKFGVGTKVWCYIRKDRDI